VVARTWKGTTKAANADAYVKHLRDKTLPALRAISGHRGAYVLRRSSGTSTEFTVVTLWDSLDDIRRFSGDDAEAAVVPAEVRALLSAFDDRAVHWDVALRQS
jgi:heme-degrading monooxygenase HmoA